MQNCAKLGKTWQNWAKLCKIVERLLLASVCYALSWYWLGRLVQNQAESQFISLNLIMHNVGPFGKNRNLHLQCVLQQTPCPSSTLYSREQFLSQFCSLPCRASQILHNSADFDQMFKFSLKISSALTKILTKWSPKLWPKVNHRKGLNLKSKEFLVIQLQGKSFCFLCSATAHCCDAQKLYWKSQEMEAEKESLPREHTQTYIETQHENTIIHRNTTKTSQELRKPPYICYLENQD